MTTDAFDSAGSVFKIFGFTKEEIGKKLENSFPQAYREFRYTTRHLDTALSLPFGYCKDESVAELYLEFGDAIYADTDITLAERLIDYLKLSGLVIGTAESLTGGLVASMIVEVPHAGDVFYEGLVTYSVEAKIQRLHVPRIEVDAVGAVSPEVAKSMAEGLLKSGKIDLAVTTTGLAGPTGGSPDKPIGLVYVGIADADGTEAYKYVFDGDRNEIRECAARAALYRAILRLKRPTDFSNMVIN